MTACFKALGNDGIRAALLKPLGLWDCGGRRPNLNAPSFELLNPLSLWQAKVKADHGGFDCDHELQTVLAEGCPARASAYGRRVNPMGLVQRGEFQAPSSFFFRLSGGRCMAEKIKVHGQLPAPVSLLGVCSDDLLIGTELMLQLHCVEHGSRNAAQAASLEHGSGQAMVLRTCHRSLNESQFVKVKK